MGSWHLAPSLAVLRDEINRRWPGRDRASDGTIGDAAHAGRPSDHNPNSRGSVNAIDIDRDGVDPAAIITAAERHPSVHYWIYNRQIADRDTGWRRERYTGSNPHTQHIHISIRQTKAAEDDRRPWGLLEDEMKLTDVIKLRTDGEVRYSSSTTTVAGILSSISYYGLVTRNLVLQMQTQIAAQSAALEALAEAVRSGGGSVDVAAITAHIDRRLAEVRADLRDAVADLGEGGAAQVRGPQG